MRRLRPEVALCTLLAGTAIGCRTEPEQPPRPGRCVVEGRTHPLGKTWRAGDDCNHCRCDEHGKVTCTRLDCSRGTCVHEGRLHEVGTSWAAGDGCNTCSCDAPGSFACTMAACLNAKPNPSPPPPPEVTCEVRGKRVRGGDHWLGVDKRSTCRCNELGIVVCSRGGR